MKIMKDIPLAAAFLSNGGGANAGKQQWPRMVQL